MDRHDRVLNFLHSFLWKAEDDEIKVYQATGKNDYFVLSEPHCIAFGGGYVKK